MWLHNYLENKKYFLKSSVSNYCINYKISLLTNKGIHVDVTAKNDKNVSIKKMLYQVQKSSASKL